MRVVLREKLKKDEILHTEIWTFWKGLERCYSFQKCFFIARGKSTKWMSVIPFGTARRTLFTKPHDCVSPLHSSAVGNMRKYGARTCNPRMYAIYISTRGFILNWLVCSGNGVNRSRSNGANLSCAFVCSNRPLWELNVTFLMLPLQRWNI